MTITISGSMKFADKMYEWKKKLEDNGFEVLIPDGVDEYTNNEENILANNSPNTSDKKFKNEYIKSHYNYIKKSDGLLIINESKNDIPNYIGGSSFMEIGFAFILNKDIFLLNPIPQMPYTDEIIAMRPIIINNDIRVVVDHYNPG